MAEAVAEVETLEHKKYDVARQIWLVFQASYRIEADLIGVADFPPLHRGIDDLRLFENRFAGIYIGEALSAVVEYQTADIVSDIHSLVVSPDYFGQGLASRLLEYVICLSKNGKLVVETAAANTPAIRLYEKFGFIAVREWIPEHGIAKIEFSKNVYSS